MREDYVYACINKKGKRIATSDLDSFFKKRGIGKGHLNRTFQNDSWYKGWKCVHIFDMTYCEWWLDESIWDKIIDTLNNFAMDDSLVDWLNEALDTWKSKSYEKKLEWHRNVELMTDDEEWLHLQFICMLDDGHEYFINVENEKSDAEWSLASDDYELNESLKKLRAMDDVPKKDNPCKNKDDDRYLYYVMF